jgi:hypothetical protein
MGGVLGSGGAGVVMGALVVTCNEQGPVGGNLAGIKP